MTGCQMLASVGSAKISLIWHFGRVFLCLKIGKERRKINNTRRKIKRRVGYILVLTELFGMCVTSVFNLAPLVSDLSMWLRFGVVLPCSLVLFWALLHQKVVIRRNA